MSKIPPANQLINTDFKIGILGGGQLGKMLALAAANWDVQIHILDKDPSFPAGSTCSKFVTGDFNNYDDVYQFGKDMDVLTIEIEHVNTEALLQLEKEGKVIHPSPTALNIIKDKGLQKAFYQAQELPTAPFKLYESGAAIKAAITDGQQSLPFVQKTRTAGYDGKGVAVIRQNTDLDKILDAPSIIEPLVDIKKEIAVIVAQRPSGQIEAFPAVEMTFNQEANLVEFLLCPADISPAIAAEAEQLARSVIDRLGLCGLLAVELFLTQDDRILINEVAPRPHNSGHHTIDSCYTSQFEQHLRAIMDLPLGSTKTKMAAVMVNLLGAPDHQGAARYQGLTNCLAVEGSKIHLYGKSVTKPYRKMGHATLLAPTLETAMQNAKFIQQHLKITT
ncbi:MAG: 5-(carboxyamino)imidazole ribonucleotide synthase [Saprospiraceae bacterium]